MSLLLGLGFAALAISERGKDLALARRDAEAVVRLQAYTIQREIELVARLLPQLAIDPALARQLASGQAVGALTSDLGRFGASIGLFERVRLLDEHGRALIELDVTAGVPRAAPIASLAAETDQLYLERVLAMELGEVDFGAFTLAEESFRIVEPQRSVLRFATRVAGTADGGGGVLEVEYLGQELLERLARAGEGLAGWTALVNARGYFLEAPAMAVSQTEAPSVSSSQDAPASDGSWGFLFGLPPTFAARHGAAWTRITGVERGSFALSDGLYAHERLTGPAIPQLNDAWLHLYAVAFVPAQELYSASSRRIAIFGAGGALVWLALAALAWRLAFVGALREAWDRQLVASRAQLRRLSSRLMDAQEEERRSLSRDLHDDLGQEATALIIELKRAARAAGPEAAESMQQATRAAEAVLEGLHRVSSTLRTSHLEDLGLQAALEALVAESGERFELGVSSRLEIESDDVTDQVARNVYRIVQEALTNVAKHAQAKNVSVVVETSDGWLRLAVTDDGVGFEPGTGAGDRLGLLGMRERAEQLGGHFACLAEPRTGTRIEVRIPLVPHEDEAIE